MYTQTFRYTLQINMHIQGKFGVQMLMLEFALVHSCTHIHMYTRFHMCLCVPMPWHIFMCLCHVNAYHVQHMCSHLMRLHIHNHTRRCLQDLLTQIQYTSLAGSFARCSVVRLQHGASEAANKKPTPKPTPKPILLVQPPLPQCCSGAACVKAAPAPVGRVEKSGCSLSRVQ